MTKGRLAAGEAPPRRWRWLGLLVGCVAIAFFATFAARHVGEMPPLRWDVLSFAVLLAGGAAFAGCIGLGGVIWGLLLRDAGQRVPWSRVQVVYALAQIGKYAPGNVGHHVGRAYLARRAGIAYVVTVHTMIVETAASCAVGACVALVALRRMGRAAGGEALPDAAGALSLLGLAAAALLLLAAGIASVNALAPNLVRRLTGEERLPMPRWRTLLVVCALSLVTFAVVGGMLAVQARLLFGADDGGLAWLTGAFAVSWLGGYLTPGAPAGLGVRESLLALLLAPVFGAGVAVGLPVTLRISTVLGDGLAFAAAAVAHRRLRVSP